MTQASWKAGAFTAGRLVISSPPVQPRRSRRLQTAKVGLPPPTSQTRECGSLPKTYISEIPPRRWRHDLWVPFPALGERHASAQPTVLSCRHSREVTIGPVACLSEEYLAQWPYERLQRPRSSTHACSRWLAVTQRYLTAPPPAISSTKTEVCGNSRQLCFVFVFFSSFKGP